MNPPPPSKDDIAEIFESTAQLLELKGENPFKVRAYQNAARAVELFSGDLVAAAATPGVLEEIPGLGKHSAAHVRELLETGQFAFFEKLRAEFPAGIFELFTLPGLGPKKIKALHEQLGVSDLATLEAATQAGRVAALAGFGKKTADNLLKALANRRQNASLFRLGDVAAGGRALVEALRAHPAVGQVSEAGSFRRRKEVLHDLDLVLSTKEPASVIEDFVKLPEVAEVLARGSTKVSVRLRGSGIACDLRVVSDVEYPFALHHFTGSKEHNIALRNRALQTRGWSINDYRITPAQRPNGTPGDPVPAIHDEHDFYRALGLDFIPPELRENNGEIEAAAIPGALPALVQLENLRGTFHCHTHASDGRNSLEEMAGGARALGLQYLGIADHSKSSFQANGLDAGRLLAQRAEIDALNARYRHEGVDFRLFSGVECDLLKDGSLDFPDDVLAQLDYVVVSVHNAFTLPEAEMTARIIRALENPHVTMLGHLTGRLLLSREGYAVDVPAVIDAAARTDTIIELNANARRLDMDWRWWKRAKERGVKCAINPDAHRVSGLQDLWFGVAQARKGWLERADVVNCLPLGKIEKALRAKRERA
ncbi:MAG: DNA polymerase/3'-5' exonuclease PolX [Verrucomicrobia bacterium]|nr:DNA polymerase/3'-5' exonuclease PolX [Verrucomicrobiota bacterium]